MAVYLLFRGVLPPEGLQGETLDPYLFIIYIDYVLRTSIDMMKDKFQTGKRKKQKIPLTNSYEGGLR